jgi:hypothetical protein
VQAISEALRRAAGDAKDPVIVINADAKATHQSVVDVMQAAQAPVIRTFPSPRNRRADGRWRPRERLPRLLVAPGSGPGPVAAAAAFLAVWRAVGCAGLYRCGVVRTQRLPVPVIVVGNLIVGGSGKTPLVLWLVEALREAGWQPGIISRGYGADISVPRLVDPASTAS